MELHDKIRILADAAKYDVSCSSSGSNRENKMAVSGMHRFTEYAIVGLMMEGAYHFLKYYLQIYAYTTAHIVSIDAQMT
ncbi:hypothetical protein PQ689_11090 [Thermoanaerobacterium thermosaccharolyticum]